MVSRIITRWSQLIIIAAFSLPPSGGYTLCFRWMEAGGIYIHKRYGWVDFEHDLATRLAGGHFCSKNKREVAARFRMFE